MVYIDDVSVKRLTFVSGVKTSVGAFEKCFYSVCSDHEISELRKRKVEHSDNNSSELPDHLKVILE